MDLQRTQFAVISKKQNDQIRQIFLTWLNNFPSQHTRRNYEISFRLFLHFLNENHGRIKSFDEISPLMVSSFRDFLKSQGKSNKTINRHLAVLSSFFGTLVAEQQIRFNPVVCKRPPSETLKPKNWATKVEMARVLNTFNQATKCGKMNYLLTRTLYETAQRFASISRLKVKDLMEMNDFLVITIELKGGRKKVLPLPRLLSLELKSYVAEEKLKPVDFIFSGQKGSNRNKSVSNSSYNEVLRVAFKRAKVKKHFTSHRLRASTLSDLINKYPLQRIQAQVSYHKSADTLLIYKNERDYEDLEKNLLLETEARTSLRDNYETPPELIDKLKSCGFNLALDICGTEENKKAPRVITEEQNALTTDWTIKEGEWIWGNVPYSLKVQFIKKMKEQKEIGNNRQLILLPNFTETSWFKEVREEVADHLLFLSGRLAFKLGDIVESAKFSSVIAIVGSITEAQRANLAELGWLVSNKNNNLQKY